MVRDAQAVAGKLLESRVRSVYLTYRPAKRGPDWRQRSIFGSISPRPIPIRRRCACARLQRRPASPSPFGRSCSDRSSRRKAGARRRSIFIRPKAAICGAIWNAFAPTWRCRSAAPSRFRKTACWPPGSRLSDWKIRPARTVAENIRARNIRAGNIGAAISASRCFAANSAKAARSATSRRSRRSSRG